jgi:hypothetical protein
MMSRASLLTLYAAGDPLKEWTWSETQAIIRGEEEGVAEDKFVALGALSKVYHSVSCATIVRKGIFRRNITILRRKHIKVFNTPRRDITKILTFCQTCQRRSDENALLYPP